MNKKIDEIIENLKQVYDPEIPVNVYDLGLIYNVDVDEMCIRDRYSGACCSAASPVQVYCCFRL